MCNNSSIQDKVCLIVIDGWGISPEKHGNAILNASTPVMDELCSVNPPHSWTQIEAHGLHVGLPEGLMGNSEVGHLNIGAGRVVYQDIVRINMSVKNKTIVNNAALVEAAQRAKSTNGRIHLAGLVSDGGVHSHIDHLFALIDALKKLSVPKLYIQFFADGRDTSPTSGAGFLQQLIDFVKKNDYGEISTIIGRYYAMDRDKRWERICIAYDALIGGVGEKTTIDKAVETIKSCYAKEKTDEFLTPIILNDDGRFKDDDTIIFFNYRSDRMREITECIGMERYKDINSKFPHPKNMKVYGMTKYKSEFIFPSLFAPESHRNVLSEWIAAKGISQFHCAETEKYAHVTFFFNGGVEKLFENEERCLVKSPKVATYDLKPEMSVHAVAEMVVKQLKAKRHPFIMCNFAPPDMVGHSGVYEATIKACEETDKAIGEVFKACKENGYVLMVTADHGNAEKMISPDGGKHTAHTCYKVPLTCYSKKFVLFNSLKNREMALCDVAPTVLKIMGLQVPEEMGGAVIVDQVLK